MALPQKALNISLPTELGDFVASEIAVGHYRTASEVIQQALRLLEEQEALIQAATSDLRARIEVGLEQAERGELLDGEEVFRELEERIAARRSVS